MTTERVWRIKEGTDNKVCFSGGAKPDEEFTQSELRATINILRIQSWPTAEYEAGLAALVELEGSTLPARRQPRTNGGTRSEVGFY